MKLSAAVRAEIAREMAAAPHGTRTALAKRLASIYGVSPSTIYKAADRRGTKRKRDPIREDYREWTRIAVEIANRPLDPKRPKSGIEDPLTLDLAIEAGVESGELPPEALAMPLGTARRIKNELGLRSRRERTHRMHADYPMQAVQIDGSSSKYLVVDRVLEDGDVLLKLHTQPYRSGYKNKPLKKDRLRVLAVGLWDMCTGYSRAMYTVGLGESAPIVCDLMCQMLRPTGDPLRPMHGKPDHLWSDQGPVFKAASSRDLLERADIELVVGEPYKKTRMGGVERGWRTLWSRFERSLFTRGSNGILLSEVNERLQEYERRENKRRSRIAVDGKRVSRAVAWTTLTRRRPADNPLHEFPANAMETMAQEKPAFIDNNGMVRWGGVEYECQKWNSRWAVARRAMDGSGHLVLEDELTGERAVARIYKPRSYGDVRGTPKTPLARLVEESDAKGADPYANPRRPADVPMPARSEPAAPLENPLDASEPALTVEEGMAVFYEHFPFPLSASNHSLVAQTIRDDGLDRQGAIALAQRLTALGELKEAK